LKVKLQKNERAVLSNVTSPTNLEDYFKCPYRSFLVHGLKIGERKVGETNNLSVGNVMHDIFSEFVKKIDSVTESNISSVIDEVIRQVSEKNSYAVLGQDKETEISFERVKNESKDYCHKIYQMFKNSNFKALSDDVEVKFGNGGKYPEISLCDGKVKLTGKIDRLDTCGDYFRVLDYKTGKVDDKDKALFVGEKLQLFLYAGAVPDKKLAGVYYLPISDNYNDFDDEEKLIARGKTLDDKEVCLMQDNTILDGQESKFNGVKIKDGKIVNGTSKEKLTALTDYAILVSEKAVEEMSNGVIVPSPYDNQCEYCNFKGMCKKQDEEGRKVKSVNEQVIFEAVKGAKDA
jgi:ATP-dependent helicase/nuclease subunit B